MKEDPQIGGMDLIAPKGVVSRSISHENQTGAKGQGGKEGNGRKGSPVRWNMAPGETFTFAEIDGPGVIRHMWMTIYPNPKHERNVILRFYWDGQEHPSVEAPLGDFFCQPFGQKRSMDSQYIKCVEGRGYNCFFPMPFRKKARLTVTNETGENLWMFWYQVDYTLGDELPDETAYFHANFRRCELTTMKKDFVILDGVKGKGRYMGCNIGVHTNSPMWWGEGEFKIYLDGDDRYPTICGTGFEDYILSAWGLGLFTSDCSGCTYIKNKEGGFNGEGFTENNDIASYRFHIYDPIYFNEDLKVTVQQIGGYDARYGMNDPEKTLSFHKDGFYALPQRVLDGDFEQGGGLMERADDLCATAYWYQTLPSVPFAPLADYELRPKGIG